MLKRIRIVWTISLLFQTITLQLINNISYNGFLVLLIGWLKRRKKSMINEYVIPIPKLRGVAGADPGFVVSVD
jgi:hypothetical protein